MDWNHRSAPVRVTKKVMGASDADDLKTALANAAINSEPLTRGLRLMPRW
jgi:hypothetical protein